MESKQFDDVVRGFAQRRSRRNLLARLVGAAGAAVLSSFGSGRLAAKAQAGPCGDLGCRCTTGSSSSCVAGLVCCPNNGDLPGGPGTCTAPSQCFGGFCSEDTVGCPATCRFGGYCIGCCSGYCSHQGACGPGPCRSAGCQCITGALIPAMWVWPVAQRSRACREAQASALRGVSARRLIPENEV